MTNIHGTTEYLTHFFSPQTIYPCWSVLEGTGVTWCSFLSVWNINSEQMGRQHKMSWLPWCGLPMNLKKSDLWSIHSTIFINKFYSRLYNWSLHCCRILWKSVSYCSTKLHSVLINLIRNGFLKWGEGQGTLIQFRTAGLSHHWANNQQTQSAQHSHRPHKRPKLAFKAFQEGPE